MAFTELNLRNELWDESKKKVKTICDLITDGSIDYGDPPNIRCCDAGPSMNSVPIRVLEYWYKPIVRGEGVVRNEATGLKLVKGLDALDFKRDPEFEIEIPYPW